MKERLLRLLALPRRLARERIDVESCRHAGHYAAWDKACRRCEARLECEWLYGADELSALATRPLATVADALAFGMAYVDAWSTQAGHTRSCCPCEICEWLRSAEEAYAQAVERLATEPPHLRRA